MIIIIHSKYANYLNMGLNSPLSWLNSETGQEFLISKII